MADSTSVPMEWTKPPQIARIGLSLHGARRYETFRLRGLWALHAYRYHGNYEACGKVFEFYPGCVSLIPPDITVCWRFPNHAAHYCVHFVVHGPISSSKFMPLLIDLKEQFDAFCDRFEEMIEYHRSNRVRAEVRLWDLLFQIVCGAPISTAAETILPTAVRTALSIIESNIHEKIYIKSLANKIGVSPNNINNLFIKYFGSTVHRFIHRNRLEKALHLLAHSSLRVKSIAIESGFPNLQHFNKVIHATTGASPRTYRERANKERMTTVASRVR